MRPRSVSVLTPPIAEPVTLYEAREHLRLSPDQTDDDSLVLGLLATARRVVERRLGQTLTATQYVATWTESPEVADLPYGPVLVDEDHALVVEADGDVVSSGSYEIESDVSSITFTSVPAGKMVVTYWAGAVPGSAIAPQLRSAILLLVGHLYANREATTADGIGELPMAFEMLLASESSTGAW
jgi:uncharacterized phiE125 gp8 family phage protein